MRITGKAIIIGLVAIVVIAVWLKRRGAPRPVPMAVSATIDHFAKGIVLGEKLPVSAAKVGGAHWVQHAGFVGAAPGTAFDRAVLLPSLEYRAKSVAEDDARLEAVELTAASSASLTSTLSDLLVAFRRAPNQGCIRLSSGEYRLVQYWIGQEDAGGVAVITDMGTMTGADSTRGIGAWSLFAWSGPFKGGETLAAAFEPGACTGNGSPPAPASAAASAAAMEGLSVAFRDSIRGSIATAEQTRYNETWNTDAPSACDAPSMSSPTMLHQLFAFSVELPADFVIEDQAKWDAEASRTGVTRYEWRAPDGSSVSIEAIDSGTKHRGGLGGISSECDTDFGGQKVHFDVGNAGTIGGRPQLTAGAAYDGYPHGDLSFVGIGTSQARQRDLLAAARTIRLNGNWKRGR